MIKHDTMVSIICNTYNHEEYIADAIEGFLMQKTNFKFEVLIHDDASTDNTASIIREYEKEYPDIIKPIYQTENQHSQKIAIMRTFQYPRVRGKYIALCEGDDYWTDENKLQKQYDAMEIHPEVDMCAHRALKIFCNTNEVEELAPECEDTIIPVEKVIDAKNILVATASLFYRSCINKNLPEFRKFTDLDYTIRVHGSLKGGILYLNDCMSVYRVLSCEHSFTSTITKRREANLAYWEKLVAAKKMIDEETNYQYTEILQEAILRGELRILSIKRQYKEMKSGKYKELYEKLPVKSKIKIWIQQYLPFFFKR